MKRRRTTSVLCVLACVLVGADARAEIVEVALPGLTGVYPVDDETLSRTATITLPKLPRVIHGASFRIVATGTIGAANCGGIGHLDAWPMEYIAEINDEGGAWIAYQEPHYQAGQFGTEAAFEPIINPSTWDFLLDGQCDVILSGTPASALLSCDPIVVPTGTVLEAYFIIDAEFELPVEPTTWGRIKALYR